MNAVLYICIIYSQVGVAKLESEKVCMLPHMRVI